MFIALCFHRSKEKEQHAQCCSCVTLDAAQVAPQRCLILHLRESNYIIFDYQPEFNRLEKGLEELLPPLFLQWQVPVKTYWNWNLLFQLTSFLLLKHNTESKKPAITLHYVKL